MHVLHGVIVDAVNLIRMWRGFKARTTTDLAQILEAAQVPRRTGTASTDVAFSHD